MGVWGPGCFENDEAADWAERLAAGRDVRGLLARELHALVEMPSNKSPDAPRCWKALAAAEVVAALNGAPPGDLPPSLEDWLSERRSPGTLSELATRAVHKVRADSELRALWYETGSPREWLVVLDDLLERLSSPVK